MARLACAALLAFVELGVCDAFIPPQAKWTLSPSIARQQGARSFSVPIRSRFMTARKAADGDAEEAALNPPVPEGDAEEAAPKPPVLEDMEYYSGLVNPPPEAFNRGGESGATTDFPINLPSYLLLVLATVASIAFTGSIFEVTGGHPEIGYTNTYIIGTLSLPTFIFLFYAAIKKGKAEVEEDDAKYGRGR